MVKRTTNRSQHAVNKIRLLTSITGLVVMLSFGGCFDSSTDSAPPSLKPPPRPPLPSDCITYGAWVFDNWTKVDAGGQDILPGGEIHADYVRCKACHGWDQLGEQGGYVRRTRLETRPNAGVGDFNTVSRNISTDISNGTLTEVTQAMVLHQGTGRSFADGSAVWDGGSTDGFMLGNLHPDFAAAGGLTLNQTECVTKFLNEPEARADKVFADIDVSVNPVNYSVIASAVPEEGQQYYADFCQYCHGDPMQNSTEATNNLPGKGGMIAYLRGDGKASELMHKMHWGVPGTNMIRAAMGNPTSGDVANVILYMQNIITAGLPQAFDDEATTDIDTALDIAVLENDSDANSDSLSISGFEATSSQGGSISENSDGTLNYTPALAFNGIDTFSYTIADADNNTDSATVTVLVGNASLLKGKAYYQDNCAICHAAGSDDTTVAFKSSDLALQANPLSTDLSIYGGPFQLMGAFSDIPQTTIDDLKMYFSSL